MKTLFAALAVLAALMFLAAPAVADWNVGDPHKMHFPQLPDPNGWDVQMTTLWLGDDWECSASGPVSDIHLWTSWQLGLEDAIGKLHVSIHENIPADPIDQIPSHPGKELWRQDFSATQFTVRPAGSGDQGWFDPSIPYVNRADHNRFYQINITGIDAPFPQKQGEIYWLVVNAEVPELRALGWKTSVEHFMDPAVYSEFGPGGPWNSMFYPTATPLDMAFVITPEPSTLLLLTMGAVGLCAYAWRRRRCP